MAACVGSPPAAPPTPASPAAAAAAPEPDFGRHHHPIATSSAEAQRYFDQGFDLVFGFNHEEAVAVVHARGRARSQGRRCRTGASRGRSGPTTTSTSTTRAPSRPTRRCAQALELSKGGPEVERAYVEAMAIRFSDRCEGRSRRRWRASTPSAMGALVAPVSRRPRCRDALRREPDEPARVEAVVARRQAGGAHRGDRRGARVGAARAIRITSARTTTTSTRSRRRRRPAARSPSAVRLETLAPGRRPSRPHAGAHLRAHRRPRRLPPAPTWRAPRPTASTSRRRRPTASTGWRITRTTCTSSPTPR